MTNRVYLAFDELLSALNEEDWTEDIMDDVRILRTKYDKGN